MCLYMICVTSTTIHRPKQIDQYCFICFSDLTVISLQYITIYQYILYASQLAVLENPIHLPLFLGIPTQFQEE